MANNMTLGNYWAKTKKELAITITPRRTPLDENIDRFIRKSIGELNKLEIKIDSKKRGIRLI